MKKVVRIKHSIRHWHSEHAEKCFPLVKGGRGKIYFINFYGKEKPVHKKYCEVFSSFKIKIISYESPYSWYSNNIGETFLAINDPGYDGDGYYIVLENISGIKNAKYVQKRDAVIIEKELFPEEVINLIKKLDNCLQK